jgi:NAD(P)-dependent dehydrogenase (short-subunit alcohol dehydrogenase family)
VVRSLDGRVIVVTGAGAGIGREHALTFAREGALVVVNDTGGGPRGDGASGAADEVVAQIRAEGGRAVANADDVSRFDTGRALVELAVESFGDLHVVVANAGILRHAHFPDMSEEAWDRVTAVHLKGTFVVARHAAAYWRDRHAAGHEVQASIVTTSSPQGLFGGRLDPAETQSPFPPEFAQANYDAAKAGILGLTLSLAIELRRYGVRTNALAPLARTRLANLYPGMPPVPEDPGEDWDAQHPRVNSAIAGWLATADCPANGTVWNPAQGSRWVTWSRADGIPLAPRWHTIAEIDALVRANVDLGALSLLGAEPG